MNTQLTLFADYSLTYPCASHGSWLTVQKIYKYSDDFDQNLWFIKFPSQRNANYSWISIHLKTLLLVFKHW